MKQKRESRKFYFTIRHRLSGSLKRDGKWYIAHCPSLDLTTQGRTRTEAKKNLREAAKLFLLSGL